MRTALIGIVFVLGTAAPAIACADHEYQCTPWFCCPKGPNVGGTIGQIGEGLKDLIKTGDASKLARPLGDALVTLHSPSATILANQFVSKGDREKISQIIGYGAIISNPVGFAIVFTNKQGQLEKKDFPAPPPPPIVFKTVSVSATFTCLLDAPHADGGRQIFAIHSSDIPFKGTNETFAYPPKNVFDKSIVEARAPLCNEYQMGDNQRSVSSARFKVAGACVLTNEQIGTAEHPLFMKSYCIGRPF